MSANKNKFAIAILTVNYFDSTHFLHMLYTCLSLFTLYSSVMADDDSGDISGELMMALWLTGTAPGS